MTISRRADAPLYRQIAEVLRERIANGQYSPHLPPEGSLANEFHVGRDTIRDALAVLRGEGVLVTSRGHRAEVRGQVADQAVPLAIGARISARMPSSTERVAFDLPDGVPVLVVDDTAYPADRYHLVVEPQVSGRR